MTRRCWLAGSGVAVWGCSKTSKKDTAMDFGEPQRRYSLQGKILRLRPENRIAVIKHERIEGWMEAMTMDFPVPDAEQYARLREGQTIRATVLVNDLSYWLTDIQVEP